MPQLTPEQAREIRSRYNALYSVIPTRTSPQEPLLLAHYTAVHVIEKILKDEELWFANPLYMNDLEEMRTGIVLGSQHFPKYAERVMDTKDRARRLVEAFNFYVAHLATEGALDTYIFCFSEHPFDDTDGLLSMWREYAAKGNGAALVFNTQKLHYRPHNPIVIAKVTYASYDERVKQLEKTFSDWVTLTNNHPKLSDDELHVAAYAAFDIVKALAICTKHRGFREEREWRAIYVPERDPFGYLRSRFDYFIGPRGVEPKLKYKLGLIYKPERSSEGVQPLTTGTLSDILEFILLGPSVSSPLSKSAFIRMLERVGKSEFSDRVFPSSIPLRPQS